MVKAIFLDVDGVLNSYPNQLKNLLAGTGNSDVLVLNKDCLEALAKLVDATGAKFVLSATWRGEDG